MTGEITELDGWRNCPLYRAYHKTKQRMVLEGKAAIRRREQENKLMNLIEEVFDGTYEPKREFWVNRIFHSFQDRFYSLTSYDWISFLGDMSDRQACGKYVNNKMKKYCMMIRDAAKMADKSKWKI